MHIYIKHSKKHQLKKLPALVPKHSLTDRDTLTRRVIPSDLTTDDRWQDKKKNIKDAIAKTKQHLIKFIRTMTRQYKEQQMATRTYRCRRHEFYAWLTTHVDFSQKKNLYTWLD
jgi:hypothetical protein